MKDEIDDTTVINSSMYGCKYLHLCLIFSGESRILGFPQSIDYAHLRAPLRKKQASYNILGSLLALS